MQVKTGNPNTSPEQSTAQTQQQSQDPSEAPSKAKARQVDLTLYRKNEQKMGVEAGKQVIT